ncbi:MAG: heme exporter protein CcmB [Gemmatimonadetes bacterium]|nr:heme exporter protein CcmB [Gemmatimonadota bacterium]
MSGSEWRRVWTVVWKDTLTERRTKAAFNAMAFFAGMVLLIFAFALGPDTPGIGPMGQTLLQYVSPGLLWVAIMLTAVLALGRSFQIELENGALEGLRLYPGERRSIGIGKILSNVLTLAAMELLVVPIGAVLYNLDLWSKLPALAGVLFLATIGLAAVGTFYAALTVNLRAREVMLPLLLFPVMVPVILGAVKATNLILNGSLMQDELGTWVRLLIVFDVVFVTVCTLTFEYVLEE